MSGIRNREDPVCYHNVFYHIKNRREKFGTDEIVRFRGDSGIEKIRFRGFLLYSHLMAQPQRQRHRTQKLITHLLFK